MACCPTGLTFPLPSSGASGPRKDEKDMEATRGSKWSGPPPAHIPPPGAVARTPRDRPGERARRDSAVAIGPGGDLGSARENTMVRSWGLRRKRELVSEALVFGGGSTLPSTCASPGKRASSPAGGGVCSRGQDELRDPKVLENSPPVSTQRRSFPETGNLYLSWRSPALCPGPCENGGDSGGGGGADS